MKLDFSPRMDPVAHWQRVLAMPNLPPIVREVAIEALRNLERWRGQQSREPGSDDEPID